MACFKVLFKHLHEEGNTKVPIRIMILQAENRTKDFPNAKE
jgi:hypothetical protein